jgi:hypothetical protein
VSSDDLAPQRRSFEDIEATKCLGNAFQRRELATEGEALNSLWIDTQRDQVASEEWQFQAAREFKRQIFQIADG